MMRVFQIGCLACLAASLGCGQADPRGSVTGTVSYQGQPVKAGTIFFYHSQGGIYQCDLKQDGYYQFADIPAGDVTVVVRTETFNPDQKPQSYGQQQRQISKAYRKHLDEYDARMGRAGDKKEAAPAAGGLSKEQKEALAKVYVKIPDTYASDKTSPLTYTIAAGDQEKNFELTD